MAGRNVQRWGMVGAMGLLLATGLLTRIACAPARSTPTSTPAAMSTRHPAPAEPIAAASAAARASAQPRPSGTPANGAAKAAPMNEPATATATPVVLASDTTARSPASHGAVPPVDRNELSLLTSIERELKRSPPSELQGLIARYRQGGDRAALISYVQRELPNDLALRVTVLRWIDEVRPEPGRTVSAQPAVPARGNGAGWARPLQQR